VSKLYDGNMVFDYWQKQTIFFLTVFSLAPRPTQHYIHWVLGSVFCT